MACSGTDGGELTGTDGDEGATTAAYKFLKFDPVALRGNSMVQIAEIAFKSGSVIVDMSGAVATNPGGNSPGRENMAVQPLAAGAAQAKPDGPETPPN